MPPPTRPSNPGYVRGRRTIAEVDDSGFFWMPLYQTGLQDWGPAVDLAKEDNEGTLWIRAIDLYFLCIMWATMQTVIQNLIGPVFAPFYNTFVKWGEQADQTSEKVFGVSPAAVISEALDAFDEVADEVPFGSFIQEFLAPVRETANQIDYRDVSDKVNTEEVMGERFQQRDIDVLFNTAKNLDRYIRPLNWDMFALKPRELTSIGPGAIGPSLMPVTNTIAANLRNTDLNEPKANPAWWKKAGDLFQAAWDQLAMLYLEDGRPCGSPWFLRQDFGGCYPDTQTVVSKWRNLLSAAGRGNKAVGSEFDRQRVSWLGPAEMWMWESAPAMWESYGDEYDGYPVHFPKWEGAHAYTDYHRWNGSQNTPAPRGDWQFYDYDVELYGAYYPTSLIGELEG